METYLKAIDLESSLLVFGMMMATLLVVGMFIQRWGEELKAKLSLPPTQEKPKLQLHMAGLAALFVLMGVIPYAKKVNDIARTPKVVVEGSITEVDTVDGHALLRIETVDRKLIKVLRPRGSAWPTTPGPVNVELFNHAGSTFISDVQPRPEV
jgi:hypothetical protein